MRVDKDKYYLNIAFEVSKRSTCLRRHYGAIIVNNDEIIATGFNGNPRGECNCCDSGICNREGAERYKDYDKCNAVHAEQNCMLEVARKDMIGATLYLSCESFELSKTGVRDKNPKPCKTCMNMIKNAGITRVINEEGVVWQR